MCGAQGPVQRGCHVAVLVRGPAFGVQRFIAQGFVGKLWPLAPGTGREMKTASGGSKGWQPRHGTRFGLNELLEEQEGQVKRKKG